MSDRPGVVVGIDGSTESRTAVQFALEEAARRGTGVRVISGLLPPQYWPDAYDRRDEGGPARDCATGRG
jgi:nucleotide-binding universal stress UspA family protein